MNKRFDNLRVAKGVYVPPIGKTYPEDNPTQSLLHPHFIYNTVFDETYPYIDDSFKYKFNNWFGYYCFLYPIVFLINHIKNGLRIHGREILKKYKKELSNGAITICNHCNRLDAPAVLEAIHAKHTTRIPMFAPNFNTKDHWYMWAVGGIPIPETGGMTAMKRFNAAFDEFHRRGSWFHIFPEAARWDYYKPLRPFQKGAFTMAYKYNMPILPCVITFRERKGIYKLFGKASEPLLSITIGEPILPDTTKNRKIEVDNLRQKAHLQMQKMAGIENNTWPAEPENE
ncbi:MAG: 1-acyl-sn-glycerol-3-phosphate acyltransferase [Paludibacteraceae bacterium]|nr:1-acyl-sn-glycerol-3-phosphate acyltransferase [Paludibacteraceae bacterium]